MNFPSAKKILQSPVVKNRVTLWGKFLFDTLTGRNTFVLHGRTLERATRQKISQPLTILMPTIFFLDRGLAWQVTIARALELRGHKVIMQPLDLDFPRRNALYYDEQDAGFIMPYYNLYTRTLFRHFGFTVRPYSHFGSTDKFAEYRLGVSSLNYDQCRAYVVDGLPIGQLAYNSLVHHFRCSPTTRNHELVEAYRDYLAIGRVLLNTLLQSLDEVNPDIIFTLNGSFLDSQLQLAIAKKRSIRTVTFEAGFMLNAIMLGENQPIITFPMAKYFPAGYPEYRLNDQQNQQLTEYLLTRSLGKDCVFDYWGNPIFDHAKIRQDTGLPENVTPDILFTNLLWDSATIVADLAFTNELDWITQTIHWYTRHPDRALLIRVHPAEVNPPNLATTDPIEQAIHRQFPKLPPNVYLIPPTSTISSYPLTDMSNATLVYASTAGLEAAIKGKPVLVAGKTHYRGQGFTTDITSKAQYWEQLANPQLPMPQDRMIAAARKYAYFFFFGFNIPFPLVRERSTAESGPSVEFAYQSERKLLPGQDASLDFILDLILGQADYRQRLSSLLQS